MENVAWQHEYVLIVDADDRIIALQREIVQAIQSNDVDGFYLNRRFWFLDGGINHCGYFPSWKLRLFRHRLGRHEQIEIDDNIALEITRYTNMCCYERTIVLKERELKKRSANSTCKAC